MIGTRAHGRTRVYRYYTCFTRARYDSGHCNASRLDADAIEDAVLAALVGFYRDQHDLIADAITAAQANHAAGQHYRRAELAATERDLARTGAAIDRYLVAFENGTLDPEDLAGRLAKLRARSGQLRARQDELAGQVASVLAASPAATLLQVADHIVRILQAGSQGDDRSPHRPDQDHRARPDSPVLPHTTAASNRPAAGSGWPSSHTLPDRRRCGSCNDQFGGPNASRCEPRSCRCR
jgi:hypothetical protein